MSQENVEAFKRGVEAANRRDVDALLEVLDPEIEWHSALLMPFEGEKTVYRGHEGIREMVGDLFDALAEFYAQYPDIRDLGDRIVAIGRVRTRGRGSGVVTESPFCSVTHIRNGKATLVRNYLDPKEALEAAGLSENVELVYRGIEAFNQGDLDAFLALSDPDVEFYSRLVEVEGGGPYRGHAGVRAWWEDLRQVWREVSAEVEEIRNLGEVTVARVRLRGHGMDSDVPWEQTQWHVAGWRGGKTIWWRTFLSNKEALEAATRLSESE